MKRTLKQAKPSNRGYALLITIVFIGIALLLFGSVMAWTSSSAKQTERNNLFSMSTGAAEAATECVIAQMSRDFFNQSLQSDASYMVSNLLPTTTGWPAQFSFGNPSNGAGVTYVSTSPSVWTTNWVRITQVNSMYSNLWAIVGNCTVASTATTVNQPYNVPATVQQQFQLCSIPIFQYAIFYNMTMEICPGAAMTVNGKTHVNGQIWADPGAGLTFGDTVETTKSNIFYNRNTNYDTQTQTLPPTVKYLNPNGSTNTSGPYTNASYLTMPLGTNLASPADILDLPPAPTVVDPNSVVGQEYLYNVADVIVSNSPSGIVTAYFQDSNNVPRLQSIPYDVSLQITNLSSSYTTNITHPVTTNWNTGHTKITGYVTNTVTTYTTNTTSSVTTTNYYSFATNTTFYDYREGKTVQALQLNVAALNSWINGTNGSTDNTQLHGDTGHYIDSVYIYNNAPADSSDLPAVRAANGAVLPSQGLTIASPQPIYVLGNYNASGSSLNNGTNVLNAAPAAFIGDAVTVLSTTWNDNNTSGTSLSARNATNTTVNAATFEGIVESTKVGSTKYYSGGVENFLRLLENWTGDTLTYNGSIVVMFDSRYATNHWQIPGNYYNPPTRAWGFDVNFTQGQANLPPISPQVKTLVPTGWSVQ